MKLSGLKQIFAVILLSSFLHSCGSGGGGSDITPPDSNTSPFFINNIGEVEVDEFQISVVTISASDNDGDLLQYSLSGNDPSYFSITNQGVITFKQPQNYLDKKEFTISVNAVSYTHLTLPTILLV